MFQRILVAADGSEHSLRATEKAIALVNGNEDAVIEIIYVVDGATSKADVLHNRGSIEIANKRKERLAGFVEKLDAAGVKYEIKTLHGEPGPTVVDYANEHDFDCVLLGSRGLNRLQSMVLGSVSHKVAKRVKSPVMIVK
ncbi:MAG: universal stress protein [Bacillaceae bacterium]|mgnify:CR=1 FL=1|nr:universal stress protein [Bacillaceae bacterium]